MTHLMIFSGIYLVISGLSLTMGYYALRMYARGTINRLFFGLGLCMSLWSLGLSVTVIASGTLSAAFWMRVSAVGYSLFYSLLLHFSLALTEKEKLLRKRWIYPLIYAPAATGLYPFVISPGLETSPNHLIFTENGWLQTTAPSVLDIAFQAYLVSFVLISLVLIWRWQHRSTSPAVKKQGFILIASISAATVAGIVTDAFNGVYYYLPIPKIAPLLFLVPLAAIFYCINRYHLMKAPAIHKTEVILSDEHRLNVFRIASIGLGISGVLLFALEYFWWHAENPWLALFASLLLVTTGILLHYARHKKGIGFLEALLVIVSLTVTPMLMINLTEFGGMTVWAFPIIMIICALVFNMRLMLFSTAAVSLIGQFYQWGVSPEVSAVIDYRAYTSRITIIIVFIASAYFVHRIYTIRLRENAEQTRTQSLLNHVSSTFSAINAENVQEKLCGLLDTLMTHYGAAKAFIRPLDSEYINIFPSMSTSVDGSPISLEYEHICMQKWQEYLAAGGLEALTSETIQASPSAAHSRWLFIPVFAPIFSSEQIAGFICFEAAHPVVPWTREQIMTTHVVSRIASGALERATGEKRVKFMAYYDSLTRLPNRQLFHDRAEQAIYLAKRNNRIVGVMFLDLDSFKSVNDTLGHEGGDMLIQAVGDMLAANLRKSDTVARFGGDEFLMMFNSVNSLDDITTIADKVLQLFKDPIIIKGQELFITASAGISVYPADGGDAETLIKHADIAMYAAKEKGKNQYALCSDDMKELAQYKMTLSNQLYRALENRELAVYYQPQVCLVTGRIVGVEALLRWFHPTFGLISPRDFIPLAEQTGLINPIGQWVLETACAQSMAWREMGFDNIRMSVNLSVVQLRTTGLTDHIRRVIDVTGIDPHMLELEVTESTMTREPDYIIGVLNDLKALGLSISIDDFGTEYSSLNRLKMLPIDRLKMDIQFVHGIDKSDKDQAITKVIINLAKNLDLKLIAEGVESSSQLSFLKQRMCDEVQGFYYYKPMPACEIEKLLSGESSCAVL